MGIIFVEYLEGQAYSCRHCRTHLAKVDELLSKVRNALAEYAGCCHALAAKRTYFDVRVLHVVRMQQFHSKNGPAWLFQRCINVVCGPKEERLMTTGMHIVKDISCTRCMQVVGWKYEEAHEESQKYKEGKYILERAHVVEASSSGMDSGHDSHSDDIDDAAYF
eukprot:GHRR01026625.1.p1 GENE.GHRR01026625.1~~GHRR01026625.1.p1  ORF type:complete len:164 (-),score=12.99 GHRR01026625.1:857-1348(-)